MNKIFIINIDNRPSIFASGVLNLIRWCRSLIAALVGWAVHVGYIFNKYFRKCIKYNKSFIRLCIQKYLLSRESSEITFTQTRTLEDLRSLNIKKLKNVTIIGGSSIYMFKGKFNYPEPVDVRYDRFAEEYRGTFEFSSSLGGLKINSHKVAYLIPRADITISLMGGIANNYAHWISEILPRLYVVSKMEGTSINVLLNKNLHQNLIKSLERFLEKFDIVHLINIEDGLALKVDSLDIIEGVGYCQFEPRLNVSCARTLTIDSQLIRDMAKEISVNVISGKYKKIYIERSSKSRGIKNKLEVEMSLKQLGFTTIKPELMTFEDQVSVFKGATHIVGATGAAFANCVFCKDDSKILILTSDNDDHLYEYWPSMLGENRLTIKYSRHADYDRYEGIAASFTVDCNQLMNDLISMDQ